MPVWSAFIMFNDLEFVTGNKKNMVLLPDFDG